MAKKIKKNNGIIFLFTIIAILMFPLGNSVSPNQAMNIAENEVSKMIGDDTVIVEAIGYELHHEMYQIYLNLTQGTLNQQTDIHVSRDGTALILGEIQHVENAIDSSRQTSRSDIKLGENELSVGSIDAPVTLVEWSDFECPFCKRFYETTIKQIKTNYIDTGKVRYVYKHFPLSFHPAAEISAQAVECANEQGVWYEYHSAIFENQEGTFGKEELIAWSSGIVPDTTAFRTCLDSNKYLTKINEDMSYGQSVGVQGTPASFVNGIKVEGAQPYNVVAALIESELAN